MGFFDRLGGVAGGLIDVVGGGAEFIIDTAHAGTKALRGDIDGAANTFYKSVQDDLLGQAVQGAFGPEGAIGSIIGGLPEFVRKPGRAVLNPAMEAWDWTIQELVDRPLGTLFTVIDATIEGGGHHLLNFDTWKQAYDINDSRTLGQAIALLAYDIDPFDE